MFYVVVLFRQTLFTPPSLQTLVVVGLPKRTTFRISRGSPNLSRLGRTVARARLVPPSIAPAHRRTLLE